MWAVMVIFEAGSTMQQVRHRAIIESVIAEGTVRIEALAERFDISIMTVHRDLDELESRGLLRKTRGHATALSTSIIESSDVYRLAQQGQEKAAIARAAIDLVEPGESLMMDDSTTVLQMGPLLEEKVPLTVVTNSLGLVNQLAGTRGISLVAVGGTYYNWASAFMGGATTEAISRLRADVFLCRRPRSPTPCVSTSRRRQWRLSRRCSKWRGSEFFWRIKLSSCDVRCTRWCALTSSTT